MPKISVIVTTYDRPHLLIHTIKDLLWQDFDDYEILLIDNSPKSTIADMLKKLMPASSEKLRCYEEPRRGKSWALNRAIKLARGDILAFTDDDVKVPPEWLMRINDCFEQLQCDCVGGRVLPLYPPNVPSWVKANPHQMAGSVVIYDAGDKVRSAQEGLERFIGCNWAFKKSVFDDCGGFRTDLGPGTVFGAGEDEEFYFRLLGRHKEIYYCPQVLIHHPVDPERLSFKYISAWHVSLGRFSARRERENNGNFVHWFGVPRYLFKGLVLDLLQLCAGVFHPAALHKACRRYFRKLGMISEYRQIYREGKKA